LRPALLRGKNIEIRRVLKYTAAEEKNNVHNQQRFYHKFRMALIMDIIFGGDSNI